MTPGVQAPDGAPTTMFDAARHLAEITLIMALACSTTLPAVPEAVLADNAGVAAAPEVTVFLAARPHQERDQLVDSDCFMAR